MINRPLIVIGGGGHAKVIISTLKLLNENILGITDNDLKNHQKELMGIPFIGNDDMVLKYHPNDIHLVNGIGGIRSGKTRRELFEHFKKQGYLFKNVIHPSVIIAEDVKLGEGVQIMAGSIIQTNCEIENNTLINTQVVVDHDTFIGQNTHVAPGAVLSGNVHIHENVHVGVGAVLIQGVQIGKNSTIGAGAVVINDVPEDATTVGVPAKVISL